MTAKEHYEAIATIHRDSGNSVTRAEGAKRGISIYVVSDPELKRLFESCFAEAMREIQRANAGDPQPTTDNGEEPQHKDHHLKGHQPPHI